VEIPDMALLSSAVELQVLAGHEAGVFLHQEKP
jgi:hypothetical protein